jgi:uncharacterized protein
MTFAYDEFNYVLRFQKGEKLVETLQPFVKEKNLKGGWIFGLGGFSRATLGFYNLAAQGYSWTELDEPLELVSLQGNIAWEDDKPVFHIHAAVSDQSLHVRGGHLKEAVVAGTAEIFIHMLDKDTQLMRGHDNETGLSLLKL